ncbi:hypothetical protein Tco_0818542 [Tanacetum coccineum]|uniref:Reverse transcriptase domain-containing protein n=1 Tax=Tanacetum coccineum TaxID=301880 RepID=A0ABQ5FW33_9ASTR
MGILLRHHRDSSHFLGLRWVLSTIQIEGLSKNAKQYQAQPQKSQVDLGNKQEAAFHLLEEEDVYCAPILALPKGMKIFIGILLCYRIKKIIDREVKRLKRSRIPLVKVRWNSKRGPEFTWELKINSGRNIPPYTKTRIPSSSAV